MLQRLHCSMIDEVDTVQIAHEEVFHASQDIAFCITATGHLNFAGNPQMTLAPKGQNGRAVHEALRLGRSQRM